MRALIVFWLSRGRMARKELREIAMGWRRNINVFGLHNAKNIERELNPNKALLAIGNPRRLSSAKRQTFGHAMS